MAESYNAISRVSQSIGKYDLVIENELFQCRVYWAKIVGSETENLFTQYTKHTFFELQYALEGRIVMQIEKQRQIFVEPQHFIIIPPNLFHQIIDGDTVGARWIMAFSLEVKDTALAGLPEEMSKLLPYHETASMRELLAIAVGKREHNAPLRRKLIAGYLECLLLEMMEAMEPFRAEGTATSDNVSENESRVLRIKRYIADYNGIGLAPADVSKKFNISERHLNRIFVSVTGKTLKEEINRQKLGKIEELVATTALSLREISEFCGFSDEYAMNKFFRRYNHCGLTDYRSLCTPKENAPIGR